MVMRRRFFNNNIEHFDINDYLTIEALEDNLQIYFPYEDLMYGIDGLGWQKLIAGQYSPPINLGQTISFKGNVSSTIVNINSFTITKRCNLLGNCMSLTSNDAPRFHGLFCNCTTIVYISNDFLPATTLAYDCYSSMFSGCSSLTTAPELPATTLADSCYYQMFYNCTSLTTAPELPATTLFDSCYSSMFSGCNSLTTAPELPATTLADRCYRSMFSGCTSLTTAPELPATTLADSCYSSMFYGTNILPDCSNIDFNSNTVVRSGGLRDLFAGTKVTDNDLYNILPINPATGKYWLPATTLFDSCYSSMFSGCNSLTTAPELPATTLADSCYSSMFYNCTSLTTAPELPATTLVNHCYGGMFNRCSNINYIKMLATDISANGCLNNWVLDVASTGTFVKNSAMTSLLTGSDGIPSGWTVVNDGDNVNLITFTVDGVEYQAEEGMTWEQYVNSVYNTVGFRIEGTGIFKVGTQNDRVQIYNDNSLSTPTKSSDTIINGHFYGTASGGSGN